MTELEVLRELRALPFPERVFVWRLAGEAGRLGLSRRARLFVLLRELDAPAGDKRAKVDAMYSADERETT
jgi:hypothetical protein